MTGRENPTLRLMRMPAELQQLLLPRMQRSTVAAGITLHGPGNPSRRFYWIEGGRIRFTSLTLSGEEHEVFSLGAGECFGEIALYSGLDPPHFATAATVTVVRSLDRPGLQTALNELPGLRDWLMTRLAHRLHLAYAALEATRASSAVERVWNYLVWLATNGFAVPRHDGAEVIALTQSALAGRTGLARSSVAAALTELKARGLVRTEYGRIVVHARTSNTT